MVKALRASCIPALVEHKLIKGKVQVDGMPYSLAMRGSGIGSSLSRKLLSGRLHERYI
jgi:hypothetical protein